ncbi:MAG TPA: DUF4388 domain-containing protein [Pyrinomonadaceae bacterium]|jgi:hypothetical protein
MAIHGTLTTMSVSDLLQFLAAGRKTGTLRFSRGKVIKEIYFQDGIVVGANTNDPKEYIGQVLIHYGKLDEAQLQVAMEEQRRTGGKLGEILVAKGFLTSASVLEILRIRTLDIIYDLFIWADAHFELFDNEPLPPDLIRIEVEPTTIIMEGIYRVDELARYRTLIPSDRAVLELGAGWTASLSVSKEVRQILYYIEKRMTVAEICYNMHDSSFNIYAKLFDLVSNGIARLVEERPAGADTFTKLPDTPEDPSELLWLARRELKDENPAKALQLIQQVLEAEPKNEEAQALLVKAEEEFMQQLYKELPPKAVPQIIMSPEGLTQQQLGPQEAFVLSRINGEWDIESILSICPFREADSLRMIKTLVEAKVIGI